MEETTSLDVVSFLASESGAPRGMQDRNDWGYARARTGPTSVAPADTGLAGLLGLQQPAFCK